jgi:hypothetical protein
MDTIDGTAQLLADAVKEGRFREALVLTRMLSEVNESLVEVLVASLRAEGATWSEIASALNVTTQAAHKRFA